jgi:hypothetical protein
MYMARGEAPGDFLFISLPSGGKVHDAPLWSANHLETVPLYFPTLSTEVGNSSKWRISVAT